MPEDKAFEHAASRLGNASELAAEYEKNRSAPERLLSKLARWDAMVTKGGATGGRIVGHSIIFASLIVAAAIFLADSDAGFTDAAGYLLIVAGPLWLTSRLILSRR